MQPLTNSKEGGKLSVDTNSKVIFFEKFIKIQNWINQKSKIKNQNKPNLVSIALIFL